MDSNQDVTNPATPATMTLNEEPMDNEAPATKSSGFQFWMIIIALMTSTFLSALDLVSGC